MGKKKTPKGVASNVSSAANPAASSTTQTANKSSILRSSFSPSPLQLSLFASVIQGLDSQHLRIHDTVSGRLTCDHAIASKATISCLDWGYHGENQSDKHHQQSKKKRKRNDLNNGATGKGNQSNAVVAFGTTDSEIHLFSPTEAKILATLKGAHLQGVRDFKFANYGLQSQCWSIGADRSLVQWDLKTSQAVRNIALPQPAHTMQPLAESLLLASHDAYIFYPDSKEQPEIFHASNNSVHTILASCNSRAQDIRLLTAAENDRSMTVFKTGSLDPIGSLRTENTTVSLDYFSNTDQVSQSGNKERLAVRMSHPQEAIAAVTQDGVLEIFPEPFDFESEGSARDRLKQRTRPATARVRIKRPDEKSTTVPLVNASFQGNEIALAWAEGGVNLIFEKLQWRDETNGNMILKDVTDIYKAKGGSIGGSSVMNGVKDTGKSHVDESHAVVANGADAADVSMDDEAPDVVEISSAEEDSESESEDEAKTTESGDALKKRGKRQDADDDVEMEDADAKEAVEQNPRGESEEPKEAEEPSFGDLLRANAAETVDVQASFADPNAQSLVPTGERTLQTLPSGMSLGTVLTQSLRTNDTNLLETCFHVKDLSTVRATIERLDSSFATILLQRLAERLHSRPGRAGSLMVWIQWTIVAHGGFLARQPELMKKLASLHRVVQDRAKSLQSLLSLKGKLDMLEAQMNLRKSMQASSRAAKALDEDDEEGVIYVEGQEESDSEDVEEAETSPSKPMRVKPKTQKQADNEGSESGSDDAESEADDGEAMPAITNGVDPSSDDEDSDEGEGLFDEEASSTDNDSVDEASGDEIDHDSVDSIDSSDADTSPPPKRPAKAKLSNGLGPRKR